MVPLSGTIPAGIFREAHISSLPTNPCSTEINIPLNFPNSGKLTLTAEQPAGSFLYSAGKAYFYLSGLQITAGQWTMSGQK